MYTLDEVLHPRVMTETYVEEAGKYFHHPLVEFYGRQSRDYTGDRFEFAYREAMKEPAPANFRGQPARVLQPTSAAERRVYMLHAFNEVNLSTESLRMVRRPDDQTLQEQGREEIHRQMEDFGDRHLIFRAVCLAKTLVDGEIHFNNEGQVLESSSGASYTVDFGVPDGHKGQLDFNGSGDLIGTRWSSTSAKILDDLDDIRIAAEEENAEEPKHIWLHHSAKRWLRDNTQLQQYVQGSPEKIDQVLRGSFIEDLNGWTWHFYSGRYAAADGTTKPYIPVDRAIITPDVGPWLRAVNGSEMITGFEGLRSTIDEALGEITEVFGDFAYVKLVDNPTKLVLRMGTNFVYAFANPKAVWMPTVDFT
ncbi:hypothetical protein Pan216_08420 [Planctomycetes bacterium Pan216]|uniref:Phage capsid family protein n=1 Tax=Kolteria novifilia TaxID=2527975 RepID=A0A518AZ53_9BACT|nr:hypothetical protein Pan216_08420 [Planctomycetes bacterium Pan216]